MIKTILSSLFFFGISQTIYAVDFSGHWTGSGQITQRSLTGTDTKPCSLVDLSITQTPSKITLKRYHAICGLLDSDWGPDVMDIRGDKIFEYGEETGTLQGNLLKTLSSDGGVQYAFNLRLSSEIGKTPILESYYGVNNMTGTIVIEGKLSSTTDP